MATRKKSKKSKSKKAKKKTPARKKVAAKKKVAKKAKARKPKARAKPKAKARPKARPKAKAKTPPKAAGKTRAPAAPPKPAAPVPPPGMVRIGVVTHYFSHLSVAIIQLETGSLREGDMLHIKGHTSDFSQRIESMEVDHVHVSEVRAGQSFGLRVREHAREHDVVYKAK